MFFVTDDPHADFDRWDAEREAELAKLPKCAECGDPIQTERCYKIDDGLICEDCLENNHMHWTEDYVE